MKKKKFDVSMEAAVSKTVQVEAETAEVALLIAKEAHSKQTVEVSLKATWVEESDIAENLGEMTIEVEGYCDECGYPFLRRHERMDNTKDKHPKGWPWIYGTPTQAQVGPEYNPDYFTWCYGCLQSPLKQLADCAE